MLNNQNNMRSPHGAAFYRSPHVPKGGRACGANSGNMKQVTIRTPLSARSGKSGKNNALSDHYDSDEDDGRGGYLEKDDAKR